MSERGNYIASPFQLFKLDWLGVVAFNAWEHTAYLVGSALQRPDFRDVDIRLLLPDEEFAARFGEQTDWRQNGPLKATNLAWSGFGAHLTGMPIDFQIEQSTDGNRDANSGRRHPLGVRLRLEGTDVSEAPAAPLPSGLEGSDAHD